MIYVELKQGDNIKYLSIEGIEYNNKWYDPGVKIEKFSYRLNGGFVKLSDTRITVIKKFINDLDLTSRVFDITISDNSNKIFEGKAVIIDENEIEITLLLRTKEYDILLLDSAPDLNDLTNRVYPRAFGIGKFVEPLLLDDVNLIYHAAYGNVQAVYDDGVSVSFAPNTDGTFTLSNSPVGQITMDVNADSSSIVDVAGFVADKLGLVLDASMSGQTPINYFANSQQNLLQFFSNVCDYANHYFYIFNNTLVLIQKYTDFSVIPIDNIIAKDGYEIIREGVVKTYNEIIKQFRSKWEKRISISNPQSVKSEEASIAIDTGFETGKILDVSVYDYFDSNISDILNQKKDLNNLHEIELKIYGNNLNVLDIGKVVKIEEGEIVDTSKDNWVQIYEIEMDYEEVETVVRGSGKIYLR